MKLGKHYIISIVILMSIAVLKGISDGLSRGKKPNEMENLVMLRFSISVVSDFLHIAGFKGFLVLLFGLT